MKPKRWYLIGSVMYLWVGVSLVMAAEDIKQPPSTVYSLGEVVVSADSPEKTPVKTVEITAEDIEKRHALTLAKALELLPGVDVRRGGQGVPRVNIQCGQGKLYGGIEL